MNYNQNNIFAKILRKEIPVDVVYEDTHTLAFYDIHPQAPLHILIIPKGSYTNYSDFITHASSQEIIGFFQTIQHLIQTFNLSSEGLRLITNQGPHGGQDVPHFHMHLLGGTFLGQMIQVS